MNKVLQKSFYRLRTVLLLMVMLVAGSSAWADSVTFSPSNVTTTSPSQTQGDVTMSTNLSQFRIYGLDFDLGGAGDLTFSVPDTHKITAIEISADKIFTCSTGKGSYSNNNWSSGSDVVNSVTFHTTGWTEIYNVNVTYESISGGGDQGDGDQGGGDQGGGDDSGNTGANSATFDFSSVAAASSIEWSGGSLGAYTSYFSTNQTLTLNNVVLKVNKAGTNTLRFRGGSDPVRLEVTTDDEISIIAPSGNKLTRVVITTVTNGNSIELTSATTGEALSATASTPPFVYTWVEGSKEISTLAFKGARSSYSGRITSIEVSYDESEGGDQGGGDPVTYDYTVSIVGAPAGQGGVVVGGETKNANFSSDTELDLNALQAAEVSGYTGVVTYVGNAITVTYTQDETPGGGEEGDTVELALTNLSGNVVDNVNGVTVSYPYDSTSKGAYLNLFTNPLVITSEVNILRVELVGSNFSTLSSTPNGWNGSIWSGNSKTVSFSSSARSFLGEVGATITKVRVTLESTGGGSTPTGPVDWTVEYNGTTGSVTYNGNNPTDGKFAIEGEPDDTKVEVGDVFGYTSSFRFDKPNHKLIITYTAVQNYELPDGVSVAHGSGNPVITATQVGRAGFAPDANQTHFNARWYSNKTTYGETFTANDLYFTISEDGQTATLHGFESVLNDQANYGTIYLLLPEGALVDKNGAKNKEVEYNVLDPNPNNYRDGSNKITIQNGGQYPVFVYNNDNDMLPPNGWGVTVKGQEINQPYGNEKVYSRDVLTANDVEVTDVDKFSYTKSVGSNVTVKYVNIYTVSVVGLSNPSAGGLTLAQTVGDYAQGTVLRQNDTFSRESGTLKVKLDGEESQRVDDRLIFNIVPVDGYDGEITFTAHEITVTYTPRTNGVEEFSPEVATYNLDDREDGFSSFRVKFEENFAANISINAGAELPNGMILDLPGGVTKGLIYANSGTPYLYINLAGGKVAGDYTVTIPQGTFNFVDSEGKQSVNAAVNQTWHLNAATKFRVNTSSDIDTKYEGNDNNFTSEGTLASLKSFVVAAPEGDTFTAPVEATMTLAVTVGEAEATDVEMGVALGTAGLTFTFPVAISQKTHVSVAFPEGTLTTINGLSSRGFNANFNIDPTEYVNISTDLVAWNHVGDEMDGPLETITITLPDGKVAANVGTEITLNNQSIAVSAPAEFTDNTVVLTLATPLTGTEATESNTFVIPEGFITTTDGAINRSSATYNVKVVKRLKVARIEVNGVELTNETTFDEIQGVRVYFDEAFGEYQYMPAGMTMKLGETPVTINNGFASGSTNNFYFYFFDGNYVSAAGTYDVHIPAGTLTSGDGHVNKDIDFSIVVNAYEPVAMELAPVNEKTGDVYEYLQNFTLTAPEGKIFNAEKGLKKFSFDGNNYTASNVQFAQDGSSVSFSLNNKVTTDGNHTIVLPVGFVKTTDGKTNTEIEVTYEVGYPYYTLGNVMPSTSNEVMYLETLTINKSYGAADFAEVAEATAITLSINENDVAATYTATANQVVITLPSEINTAGGYTIAIPAGVISAGGKTNEAKEITYTVAGDYALESSSPSTYADLDDLSYIVVAPARYDVEFDEVPANVTITVNGDNVTASVAKNNNEFTLTFDEITKGGSYEVVIPAGTFNAGHGKGNAEFSRTYKVSAKVAISAAGWTSFCLDAPFKLAAGFTPYYVTGTEDNGITLTLEKVKPVLEEQDTNMDFTSYGWNPATHFANYNNEYLTITTTGSFSNSTGSLAGTGTIEFSTGETGAVIKSIEVVPYRNDNNYVNYCYFDGNGDNTTKELNYSANSESVTMHANFGYVSYINVTVAAPTGDVVIPAGEGILIQGGQGAVSYTKLPVGTPTSVIEDNMLVGKLVTETITDDPDNFYYKFTLNKDQDPNSAGFYWGSADGHSITMNPNKAYIIRPASAGIRNRFLINGFDEETTAIDAVDNVTDEAPIYNLQGQRVNVARAGVYIKNGKKFIAK